MLFRFLQTGDIHIGRGRASWGEDLSLERGARLLDELYAAAHAEKCHALLITGDVFDNVAVTNRERELVSQKLAEYSGTMPTYVISGNHDLRTSAKSSAKPSSNLDFLAEITERSNEIANLHVSFADHPSVWEAPAGKSGLYIVGASEPLSAEQKWVDEYTETLRASEHRYIFMGHATVAHCIRNDSLWKPEQTKDKGISLATAGAVPNIIWFAYGDIHKRQKLPTLPKGANGWYAGSPIQMNFGEEPDRGALVVVCEWAEDKGWFYKGRRYVRLDDRGFAPLVTITNSSQIDSVPPDALVRLPKGLRVPKTMHDRIVASFKVGEDHSTPEAAYLVKNTPDGEQASLEAFDPLVASAQEVEDEVLGGLPDGTSTSVVDELKNVIKLSVARYTERIFVS